MPKPASASPSPDPPCLRATAATYVGLFTVSLATLLLEILLTRIFSVTTWYHYAFLAVSLALFGMTAGAVLVYLCRGLFTPPRLHASLAIGAMLFGVTAVGSVAAHLALPTVNHFGAITSFSRLILTYVLLALPFVGSGVTVCLALTKFPRQIGSLYATDLMGAAAGCLLVAPLLNLTNGPTAVVIVAGLGFLASAGFAAGGRQATVGGLAVLLTAASLVLAWFNTTEAHWLKLRWVKGLPERTPLYEKWNAFSRIRVYENTDPRYLYLDIDGLAATLIPIFRGDLRPFQDLTSDITNVAHHLRRDASVLVVGSGGGKDLLSALVFNQRSVLGVEVNREIVRAVTERFGDRTDPLTRDPRVTIINDEARSFLAGNPDRYDIIQVSLIDTWAATASGAYVLTENSLYTVEGWEVFLDRLHAGGVLSITRWYRQPRPDEFYRLVTLAGASLERRGVVRPSDHLFLVRQRGASAWSGLGTLLVSREPFSPADVASMERIVGALGFDLVLSPQAATDATLEALTGNRQTSQLAQTQFPVDLSAPTDDRPFFFFMLRLRDFLSANRRQGFAAGPLDTNLQAVSTLGYLLLFVTALAAFSIIGPLVLTGRKTTPRGAAPAFLYFAAIGLGFMLVEISQLQRLIIFLGHPTYGVSVVLFSLLLSSGLGSLIAQRMGSRAGHRRYGFALLALVSAQLAFGKISPAVILTFAGASTLGRIVVAVAILSPLGLLMGMAFPIGLAVAARQWPTVTPWLWGINGATSVVASVLGMVIALAAGIAATFWVGVICYLVAFGAYAAMTRRTPAPTGP